MPNLEERSLPCMWSYIFVIILIIHLIKLHQPKLLLQEAPIHFTNIFNLNKTCEMYQMLLDKLIAIPQFQRRYLICKKGHLCVYTEQQSLDYRFNSIDG